MKIGYLGIPGSYSEMTARDYVERSYELRECDNELIGYSNFDRIIQDLVDKDLEYGVLPAENSTTGLISRAVDLLHNEPLTIIDDAYQPVSHTLWGLPGAKIEDLKQVYSHPEALSQCDEFFDAHSDIEEREYSSTAQAVQFIKELGDKTNGALASRRAGELIGLEPLLEDVQTENNNATRFYIIRRQEFAPKKGRRLVLHVQTKHESGALSKVLQVFAILNCNLELLTARPIPGRAFAYGFIIEVDIDQMSENVELLLAMIRQVTIDYQVFGQFEPNYYALSQKDDDIHD
ncbi:prephenate dehydratase [Aerococcaceae bacterium DSM 111022]|nr:prephenate dehydratase [Aerococcaceae bacterium DSM 111022]